MRCQDEVAHLRNENGRLRSALAMAAERFADVASMIEEGGLYSNAGFFLASARRCREALDADTARPDL